MDDGVRLAKDEARGDKLYRLGLVGGAEHFTKIVNVSASSLPHAHYSNVLKFRCLSDQHKVSMFLGGQD